MKRRHWLAIAGVPLATGSAWWWVAERPAVAGMPSIEAALALIDELQRAPRAMRSGWPLAQVLEHCAQSIEYSMDGYPEARSAVFRHTVGALAFGFFDRHGAMRHNLTEAIPGAPALASTDVVAAGDRLRQALLRFEATEVPMRAHFAYGELDKSAYRRAHLMHVANHFSLLA
jgi:hypothetical protein